MYEVLMALALFIVVVFSVFIFLVGIRVKRGIILLIYFEEKRADWITYSELQQATSISKSSLNEWLRKFVEKNWILSRLQAAALSKAVDRKVPQLLKSDLSLDWKKAERLAQQEITKKESQLLKEDDWIESYEFRYRGSGGRRKRKPKLSWIELFKPAYARTTN